MLQNYHIWDDFLECFCINLVLIFQRTILNKKIGMSSCWFLSNLGMRHVASSRKARAELARANLSTNRIGTVCAGGHWRYLHYRKRKSAHASCAFLCWCNGASISWGEMSRWDYLSCPRMEWPKLTWRQVSVLTLTYAPIRTPISFSLTRFWNGSIEK